MVNLLSISQAAEALGLAEITVRRAFLDGRLPGVKLGRVVRFRAEDLERVRLEGLPPRPRTARELAAGRA